MPETWRQAREHRDHAEALLRHYRKFAWAIGHGRTEVAVHAIVSMRRHGERHPLGVGGEIRMQCGNCGNEVTIRTTGTYCTKCGWVPPAEAEERRTPTEPKVEIEQQEPTTMTITLSDVEELEVGAHVIGALGIEGFEAMSARDKTDALRRVMGKRYFHLSACHAIERLEKDGTI